MPVVHALSDDVFDPFHVTSAFLHEFRQPGLFEVLPFMGRYQHFIEPIDPGTDVKSEDGLNFFKCQ